MGVHGTEVTAGKAVRLTTVTFPLLQYGERAVHCGEEDIRAAECVTPRGQ